MAELIGVRVEGAQKLRRTLKKAGVDMKDLTRLNKEAANTVVPVAKALAPVGDPRNGHIKTTVRAGATQRAGIIRAGDKKRPYGGPIHWGWPARGIKAEPWIAIAAKQTENQWTDVYWDGLMKVIDQVKGD